MDGGKEGWIERRWMEGGSGWAGREGQGRERG